MSALSHDELVVACRNIGFDLTCGACASLFYTGHAEPRHDETCGTGNDQLFAARKSLAEALDTISHLKDDIRQFERNAGGILTATDPYDTVEGPIGDAIEDARAHALTILRGRERPEWTFDCVLRERDEARKERDEAIKERDKLRLLYEEEVRLGQLGQLR